MSPPLRRAAPLRERPIIFGSEFMRALLDGAKTQARLPLRTQPSGRFPLTLDLTLGEWYEEGGLWRERVRGGLPGERLWCREIWNLVRPLRNAAGVVDGEAPWRGPIPVTDQRGRRLFDDWRICYKVDGGDPPWRSPLDMPRWASRLTLEIVSVRIARLQTISDSDAMAEGAPAACADPRAWFQDAWTRVNGKRSPWARNDFITVLEVTHAN
jgi:hypothetical protein